MIRRMDADAGLGLQQKIAAIYAMLIVINGGVWLWAFVAFHGRPILLGTALLAFSFGLRHAVDADHIAAIDNVTRKQMQQGRRPVAVGFFFSLGHSSVVVLASLAISLAATLLKEHLDAFKHAGGIAGTAISSLFLFVIATMNLVILGEVWRTFRSAGTTAIEEQNLDIMLLQGGFLARIFRRLFRLVTKSWHMFPLGFLFGLGFDTASEIALLGISAAEASKGLPAWSMMVFPLLFTAGMTLIDTTDGMLMLGAYGWAFAHPTRKLIYNVTITLISALIAFIVGGIELLDLVGDRFTFKGCFWKVIGGLNDNFGTLGYAIIAFFFLSWVASVALYRVRASDKIGLKP